MAVRKTESRIPGGYAQIDRLGENNKDDTHKIAIVSFIQSPLKYIETSNELSENTYAVLFESEPANSNTIYFQWEITLYKQGQVKAMHTIPVDNTDNGFLVLDSNFTNELWCLDKVNRIEVKVTPTGYPPLVLKQDIERFPSSIRDLMSNNTVYNASGGSPAITRIIAACYKEYLDKIELIDAIVSDNNSHLKKDLITAIIYYGLLKRLDSSIQWNEVINNSEYTLTNVKNKRVGIAGLCPAIVASFLKNDYIAGNPALINVPESGNIGIPFQERAFRQFQNVYGKETEFGVVTDVFNLLRFPRTSIELCGSYLEKIREDLGYGAESWNQIIMKHTGTKLLNILCCYFDGPESTTRTIATDVLSIINSSFIKMLTSNNSCAEFRNIASIGLPSIETTSKDNSEDDFKNSTFVEFSLKNKITRIKGQTTFAPMDYEIFYNGFMTHFEALLLYNLKSEKIKTYNFIIRLVCLNSFNYQYPLYDNSGSIWDEKYDNTTIEDLINLTLTDKKAIRFMRNEASLQIDYDAGDSFPFDVSQEDDEQIIKILLERMSFFRNIFREIFCELECDKKRQYLRMLNILRNYLIRINQVKGYLHLGRNNFPNDLSCIKVSDSETTVFDEFLQINTAQLLEVKKPPYNWEDVFFSKLHIIEFKIDKPQANNENQFLDNDFPLKDDTEFAKMENAFEKILSDKEKTRADIKLIIHGYADKSYKGTGSREDYNNTLSINRAEWVKEQFKKYQSTKPAEKQIADDDIKTYGCGHNHAPGSVGIDKEIDLDKQKYRDVRMVLMIK